jgi:outer membrane protein OmpA-like peptidoglycan-associated protein
VRSRFRQRSKAHDAPVVSGVSADGKVHADMLSLKRTEGDTVTLRFAIVNDSNRTVSTTLGNMRLIDLVGRTSYEPGVTSSTCSLAVDVLFDFDKSDRRAEAASTLHNLADIIRAEAHGRVAIRGYTDVLGKDAYNQRLSEQRAASVKTCLVGHEQLG